MNALLQDDYGYWRNIIQLAGQGLKPEGVSRLKVLIDDLQEQAQVAGLENPHVLHSQANAIESDLCGINEEGYRSSSEMRVKLKLPGLSVLRGWRQDIADLEGDVDAWMAELDAEELTNPSIAAEAARRLINAERLEQALALLENLKEDATDPVRIPYQCHDVYIEALSILGRVVELNRFRWHLFTETLDGSLLRELLAELPDEKHAAVLARAEQVALSHDDFDTALEFLIDLPRYDLAAELICARFSELDGAAWYSVSPAADMLQPDYPLAAVLCRRSLINYTLEEKKTSRYKHAIRHVQESTQADPRIEDYCSHPDHRTFMKNLKTEHHRKHTFWSGLDQASDG